MVRFEDLGRGGWGGEGGRVLNEMMVVFGLMFYVERLREDECDFRASRVETNDCISRRTRRLVAQLRASKLVSSSVARRTVAEAEKWKLLLQINSGRFLETQQ